MKSMIVLLAAAAFACGVPHTNLKFLIKEARMLTLDAEVCESVFVKDLKQNKTDICEAEFFCQAEKVLSDVKFPTVTPDCNVNKLLRNLKLYNNGMNCTVPNSGVEIILHSFLDDLTKCAKKFFSKIPRTPLSQ